MHIRYEMPVCDINGQNRDKVLTTYAIFPFCTNGMCIFFCNISECDGIRRSRLMRNWFTEDQMNRGLNRGDCYIGFFLLMRKGDTIAYIGGYVSLSFGKDTPIVF